MTHGKKKFLKHSPSIYFVTLSIFLYMLSGVAFAEIPYIPFGPKGLLFSCHQEQTRSECRGTLLDADGTEVRFRRAKDSIKIRMRKAAQRRKRAKIRGDRKALLRAIADASTLRQVRNGMHGCRLYRTNRCKIDTGYYSNDRFGEACEAFGSSLYNPEEETLIVEEAPDQERSYQRIVNGSSCSFSQSPVVPVDLRGSQYCTGNVIGDTVVLTAAHCVKGVACEQLSVTNGSGLRRDVLGCAVHPDYDGTEKHDLALLYLGKSIETDILPIYTSNDMLPGEEVLFAGYGLSESDDYAHLRATKSYLTEVTESQLVIEYDANNPDVGNSCYGDSGGPMTIKRDDYWALIGVVSSGNAINCALPGYETHDVSRWTNLTSDKNLQFIKNYTENILD